ncbi:ClpP/crotonase-like domain-containing protein [Apodospora peruviana]|uniref:ClpP/crotonase-like domain-containing protein n=1 Tax=Apodospora peruviana TaxID=516989 RepID=A0AAE0M3S3_9PEZI|nr:ClpP/crotonase-like domain-containing protein [Apodospora peruviana]
MPDSPPSSFAYPPPALPEGNTILLSYPAPHVLLVTLNRPAQRNAVTSAQHAALASIWDWYDSEPSLRCAVITGAGGVAFCAGADLKEWDNTNSNTATPGQQNQEAWRAKEQRLRNRNGGFGGLSNRLGKKPVIAAVNGLCLGGGMEMAINCDMVVAGQNSRFGLPEVGIGVVAVAGALARLVRSVGKQRATEIALLGRTGYTATQMERWGLVNLVVDDGEVVKEAVKLASGVAGNSPDAVIASREGLKLGWEGIGVETATEVLERGLYAMMDKGENMKEGVKSFVERRRPVWRDSKL